MPSRTLRFLAPAVLAVAALPAAALAASTGPSTSSETGSVAVTTNDVSELRTPGSQSHGRFNGQLALANAEVKYFFRYAVDTGGSFEWTNQTATQLAGAPNTSATVTATDDADDLQPNTTYLIRLVAKLSDGTLKPGNLVRFTTPAASGSGGSGSGGSGSSGSGSSGSGSSGSTGPAPVGDTAKPIVAAPAFGATLPDEKSTSKDDATDSAPATAPTQGQTAGVAPSSGTVLVREPRTGRFVELTAGDVVPLGSVVDTRRGTVALTTMLPSGGRQTGFFSGGLFQIKQGGDGYTDLYLRGPVCARKRSAHRSIGRASLAIAAGRRAGGRRLFGKDKGGKFRTHGRHSHATVRGTRWMVEDRCNGTLTTVSEGAVAVRDLARKRTVLVKAGGRYLARAGH